MNRDRWTQLLAVTLTLGCIVAAVLLTTTINSQRRDLQLSFDIEVGDRVDPRYAIAAALGSFRGLAVDVLWYRAEQLKREGKHWEAATLADWITTLQPRFPHVWSFHAWNMAYNISVLTQTPEERWLWVNKGIRLLREEGIPNNPTAIRLYRELGWIFVHKFGEYTDEMHWHYKTEMAHEWQEVLGTPIQGEGVERAIANFTPIAIGADRYFRLDRPSREMRQGLRELAEANPDYSSELTDMMHRGLVRFQERAPSLAARMRNQGQRQPAEQLTAMMEQADERLSRATRDPLNLLYDDLPETRPFVEQLRAIGFDVNEAMLRRVGQLEMYLDHVSTQWMFEHGQQALNLSDADLQLLRLLVNEEHRQAIPAVLTFLRARVLVQRYHMDPTYMLDLMEQYGPIDWRHPAAHAVYWSALGVEMIREVRDTARIDIINTNRQVIIGVQALFHTGRVNYDPITGEIDLLPEPAFAQGYETALNLANARLEASGLRVDGALQSFQGGHENFLLNVIVYSYLYGEIEQARRYYDRVRDLYGDTSQYALEGRYEQTLDDLVFQYMSEDIGRLQQTRQFIDGMITTGLRQGLAQGRVEYFNRNMQLARRIYERYQEERGWYDPNAPRDRLGMRSTFRETFSETYIAFMRSPRTPLTERSRAYLNTITPIRRDTFPYFREQVTQQANQLGYDPARMFPAPPVDEGEGERELPARRPTTPDTVERQ